MAYIVGTIYVCNEDVRNIAHAERQKHPGQWHAATIHPEDIGAEEYDGPVEACSVCGEVRV